MLFLHLLVDSDSHAEKEGRQGFAVSSAWDMHYKWCLGVRLRWHLAEIDVMCQMVLVIIVKVHVT